MKCHNIKLRERDERTWPGRKVGRRIVLGWQFRLDRKWSVVTECWCGRVLIIKVSDLMRGKSNKCKRCANRAGPDWEPTPEEIRRECEKIKAEHFALRRAEEYAPPS